MPAELTTFSFRNTPDLKVENGFIFADIAVWVVLDQPKKMSQGRMYLRYFDGTRYKEMDLDRLRPTVAPNALMAARIRLPALLRNETIEVLVDIDGSAFKVDSVHLSAITEKPIMATRKARAA